jgi:hypothetical protein
MLLRNGIIIKVIALLPRTLFLTALRLERVALNAGINVLQMSFFLVLSMLQEYKALIDQYQQPPEVVSSDRYATRARRIGTANR